MNLSDVVVLDQKFARSINLERDSSQMEVVQKYQVTGKAQEVVERFVAALEDEKVSAWSLVGPYGMGKSAFLNFFLGICGPDTCKLTEAALSKLEGADERLYRRFLQGKGSACGEAGFFRVPVVSSFEPVNLTLARGLRAAISGSTLAEEDSICQELDTMIADGPVESIPLLGVFEKVAGLARTPMIVVVDELGKNLEYLSYNYHEGDLFILQQLSEMKNVYLFVSLHQAFQDYMSGFSAVQQREWSKVQGRFEEISFVESTAQMLHFMRDILGHNFTDDMHVRTKKWASGVRETLEPIELIGKEQLDAETIRSLYPLHPITSVAVTELCRKYAQNERTLVSFLCSGHPYALPAMMQRIAVAENGNLPSIGLDALYDYFFRLNNVSLPAGGGAQRWVEIHEIIESTTQFSDEYNILLRNIGVLNVLGGSGGLKASSPVLSSIMEYAYSWDPNKTEEMLATLVRRGSLFYRDHSGEFRLWEGTDFDVNAAIAREKDRLSLDSLEGILEKYLPLSPIIAARHYIEKGTMRKFERRWVDHENLVDKDLLPQRGFDGLLVYCYGAGKRLSNVPSKCEDGRPLVVSYAPVKETLLELALELVACQHVLYNYPQLSHDKVARREVVYRCEVLKDRFKRYSEEVFAPGAANIVWYANGAECELKTRRELSSRISELCDECYDCAPTIGNEIVSDEKLSGVAARARRELVEAMATSSDKEQLGLVGFGPEVAVYRSLILAKGLHKRDDETGHWFLTLDGNESGLKAVWGVLDEMLKVASTEGVSVADMVDRLREPPFGLRQGPSLIYICLYLLVKSEELIVFCDGVYQPYMSSADVALLLKRADLFRVKTFLVDDIQEKAFSVYKAAISRSRIKVDSSLRNATMLGVVGPLMKFVDELPRYSKQTRSLSRTAQRVRASIMNAVDPLRFLFEDLPEALDIQIGETGSDEWISDLEASLTSALTELEEAFGRLNRSIGDHMLQQFGSPNPEEFCSTYSKKASLLYRICDDSDLRPVLGAMARIEPDITRWLQGVAGAMLKKPVDAWRDEDFELFKVLLADYADRIEQLEVLAKAGSDESNLQLITIMNPGGTVRREVFEVDDGDEEVRVILNQILKLPQDKSRSVLALLARTIILGGQNDG
jgi:hypothetical protein